VLRGGVVEGEWFERVSLLWLAWLHGVGGLTAAFLLSCWVVWEKNTRLQCLLTLGMQVADTMEREIYSRGREERGGGAIYLLTSGHPPASSLSPCWDYGPRGWHVRSTLFFVSIFSLIITSHFGWRAGWQGIERTTQSDIPGWTGLDFFLFVVIVSHTHSVPIFTLILSPHSS
jgi:hypothetical protein